VASLKGQPQEALKTGIVAAMAFPEYSRSGAGAVDAVERIANDPFFRAIDVARIEDAGARKEAIAIASERALEVVFVGIDVLLRDELNLSAKDAYKRRDAVEAMKRLIEEACEWGARGFSVLSGPAVSAEERVGALRAMAESLVELAAVSASLDGPLILLETFDGVAYGKNRLVGPTSLAVDLAGRVREEAENFGLVIDLSHLPLLGEKPADAVRKAHYALEHVHAGNCVMRHPNHPAYGDNHPPFGIPEGEIGADELAEYLEALAEVGYIGGEAQKTFSFEIKCAPGGEPEAVIENAKETLGEAWRKMTGK